MYLQTTTIVFECPPNSLDPPGRVLKMTAKRYWTHDSDSNDEGVSLLFAHCIGSHKEQWEPIIERTFQMTQEKARHQRVREAWSFDWQNHGDAAILNRELLASSRTDGVSAYEWAAAIAAFVRSPRMHGRRIVGIAHSAGAGAIVMALKGIPVRKIPYISLVLIEPTIATPEVFSRTMAPSTPSLVAATMMRRERWRSRSEAAVWLQCRAPWKRWDPRVLDLFIEHGLVNTPDGDVMLKCDRRQEALAFPDFNPHFDAVGELARIGRFVPVHVVWASRSELIPKLLQDSLSEARAVASITRLVGGHLVRLLLPFLLIMHLNLMPTRQLVQEVPDRVAQVISDVLDGLGVSVRAERSRL
ncbi:Alpha/beta hydrolase family-domain-containing protein [Mycena leptocephala]|nr:Alpha/beta hydrolase family-domain-containing protein [Mycena leptocephala]